LFSEISQRSASSPAAATLEARKSQILAALRAAPVTVDIEPLCQEITDQATLSGLRGLLIGKVVEFDRNAFESPRSAGSKIVDYGRLARILDSQATLIISGQLEDSSMRRTASSPAQTNVQNEKIKILYRVGSKIAQKACQAQDTLHTI